MAKVIKFESPATRRIEKINKEIEHIGDSAKAKVLQEQLMTENGKNIPYMKRAQTTEDFLDSMRDLMALRKEKDELLGKGN